MLGVALDWFGCYMLAYSRKGTENWWRVLLRTAHRCPMNFIMTMISFSGNHRSRLCRISFWMMWYCGVDRKHPSEWITCIDVLTVEFNTQLMPQLLSINPLLTTIYLCTYFSLLSSLGHNTSPYFNFNANNLLSKKI